jgi:hypothetical protein
VEKFVEIGRIWEPWVSHAFVVKAFFLCAADLRWNWMISAP